MPQVEVKYSQDLQIDTQELFLEIEASIAGIDSKAGPCKSRAFQVSDFLHSHVFVHVSVLRKPYRDTAFMEQLQQVIGALVKSRVPATCYCSVALDFLPEYYFTS